MKRNDKFDKVLFSGEWYYCNDLELLLYQQRCINVMNRYNKTKASAVGLLRRARMLKKMFGAIGEESYVEPPIHANFGGKNVFIGKRFYANFNLTLVDDGKITIGDNVMIGPNVTIATPLHPLDEAQRETTPITDQVFGGFAEPLSSAVEGTGFGSPVGNGQPPRTDDPDKPWNPGYNRNPRPERYP